VRRTGEGRGDYDVAGIVPTSRPGFPSLACARSAAAVPDAVPVFPSVTDASLAAPSVVPY